MERISFFFVLCHYESAWSIIGKRLGKDFLFLPQIVENDSLSIPPMLFYNKTISKEGTVLELYNKRMIQILELLTQNRKVLSSDQIALSIGVSSRTIRNDIKELNGILHAHGATILSEAGSGYYLNTEQPEAFTELMDQLHAEEEKDADTIIPSDPRDRAAYIMQHLLKNTLRNEEIIDPNDLADEVFVSMSTLKKDIRQIDKMLERFSLKGGISTKKGVHIIGSEANIRYCISEFIFKHNDARASRETGFFDDIVSEELFSQLHEILLETMKKYDMRLTDIAFKNLIVHIVIILKRSFHERRVDYEEAEIRQLESHMEFAAAKEVLAVIYHKLHIDITDEVYYLTQHLISSKKFLTTNFTDENEEYEFKKEIQAILYRIREDTNVDLSDDTQLINGLAVHLSVAVQRLRFHMNIRNDFLDYMKNNYPFAFELAVKASEIVEHVFSIKTNENEIGLLAIHFGAALERKGLNEKQKIFEAVIVCASGMATAMLMKERVKQFFQNRIHIVKTCPLYEVTQALIDSVDLVLTSVPVETFHSEKILQTQLLLDDRDVRNIETFMTHHHEDSGYFKEIFREDLYFTNLKLKTRDEVLHFITDAMIEKGYMKEENKQSVFKREAMATTELGSMVAMPHSLENDMLEASVSVTILDKPIVWDQEKVQVVLLLNIPKSKYGMWEDVFKTLYKYLIRDFGVRRLAKGCTYEEFIRDLEYQRQGKE